MPPVRLLPLAIAAATVAVPLYLAAVTGQFGSAAAQDRDTTPGQAASPPADPGLTDLLAPVPADAALTVAAAPLVQGTCTLALADMLAAEGLAQTARAQDLDLRARWLEAMERRVAEQIAALDAARQEVAQLTETRTALAEADLARLVAIYENMKPKDAARLLSAQPTAIVIDLMDRMRERNAAPILAEMDAAKVTDLTRGLADRRKLPGDRAPAALEPRAAAANTGADDPAALPLTIAPRL